MNDQEAVAVTRWAYEAWDLSGDPLRRFDVGADLFDAIVAVARHTLLGKELTVSADLQPREWRALDGWGNVLARGECAWDPEAEAQA